MMVAVSLASAATYTDREGESDEELSTAPAAEQLTVGWYPLSIIIM